MTAYILLNLLNMHDVTKYRNIWQSSYLNARVAQRERIGLKIQRLSVHFRPLVFLNKAFFENV